MSLRGVNGVKDEAISWLYLYVSTMKTGDCFALGFDCIRYRSLRSTRRLATTCNEGE